MPQDEPLVRGVAEAAAIIVGVCGIGYVLVVIVGVWLV